MLMTSKHFWVNLSTTLRVCVNSPEYQKGKLSHLYIKYKYDIIIQFFFHLFNIQVYKLQNYTEIN